MRFGAAYYPEHWPVERWELDARMMREAGFNTVRMAEFAWTRLEPSQGEFDFDWLDEVVGLLGSNGVRTLMCTPTAAPPGWVVKDSPEMLPFFEDGRMVNFGGRRHYCPTQPRFRDHVERIVGAMGRHYAEDPDVIAWQIDNEFGCHQDYCYCESCQLAFQVWLQSQYESLDELNSAWGTDFWSEVFTSWDEIPAPRFTSTAHNPSLQLAWRRFYTDVWTNFYTFQADILRESGVTVPITTNLMGLYPGIDYYTHAEALDFVTWDNYPVSFPVPADNYTSALNCDLMRSVKDGAPYWVVEQQSGAPGWQSIFGRTGPGYIRLMTYLTVAHGGEGVLYFRWRSCRFGVEQYWHGILQHDGRPNWRYQEVAQVGKEFAALPADLFSARTPAQVALLFSHDQQWAHQIQPHVNGFSYLGEQLPAYQALRDAGVDVDLVNEESDLSKYRILIAPVWELIPSDMAEQVIEFVRQGGTLALTFRSAVKDWDNVIFEEPLPGPLRELLGITVDDYDAIGSQNITAGLQFSGKLPVTGNPGGTLWADVITSEGAEVAATFTDGWYVGRPAITVNHFGIGQAWYIGTHLEGEFWTPFVNYLLAQQHLPASLQRSAGVDIAHRQGERLYTFVLNMKPEAGWIEIPEMCTDLLTGERLMPGRTMLEPYGVRILA
ncbi:MAG: beta-galactosidase [Armatimonadota bacterium]